MTAAEISREEWIAAQKAHLEKEKELTRARDALAAARRKLPRLRIDKAYAFRGPHGEVSLADLFDGRSQLLVQHFMFAPEWEEGCVGCSFQADHVDAARQHFEQHDLSFAAVSRAPVEKIEAFTRAHGLELHLGVLGRQRLQLRLRRLLHAAADRRGRGALQLRG